MGTKNLLKWKPEGGFPGLAAVLPSSGFAFAVFAAAVMVLAGCDSLAGTGSAGGPSLAVSGTKTIKVKFNVKNGGGGLIKSEGLVSTWDDYNIVYDHAIGANDYTLTITVPEAEEWLNVRWKAKDAGRTKPFYVFAQMEAKSGTIMLDYNGYKDGRPVVATENLVQAEVLYKDETVWDDAARGDISIDRFWENLKERSARD